MGMKVAEQRAVPLQIGKIGVLRRQYLAKRNTGNEQDVEN